MIKKLTVATIIIGNSKINLGLLLVGSILLVFLSPSLGLETVAAIFGLTMIVWYWFKKKWLSDQTLLLTLFIWYLIAFYLQSKLANQVPSLLISYLLVVFFTLQQQDILNMRNFVVAQALGIGILELFLVILFWPINFASRAMVLTAVTFIGWEIIRKKHLDDKNILLSFCASLLIILLIAWSADWFIY